MLSLVFLNLCWKYRKLETSKTQRIVTTGNRENSHARRGAPTVNNKRSQ